MVFDLCHTLLPMIHVLPVSETSSSAEPRQSSLAPISKLSAILPTWFHGVPWLPTNPSHFSCRIDLLTQTLLSVQLLPGVYLFGAEWGGGAFLIAQNLPANAGDPSWIPGSGRSAGEGIGYPLQYSWASLVAQLVKNPPVLLETRVWSLDWEDPLGKFMPFCHASLLAFA